MKHFLPIKCLLLTACVLFSSVDVFAAVSYITRGGVRYRYNDKKTEVYVTVLSDNKVYVGDIEVPATIVNSSNQTIPVVGVYASAFADCTNLKSVKLAESVTAIGDYAFDGCENLVTVEMPGVKTIGHWSFRNCYALKDLQFGNQLTTIGNFCFDKNLSMTVVDLPASMTKIGGYAFEGNPQLTSVICRATTPPTVVKGYLDGEEIWTLFEDNNYGDVKLYVPEASIMDYKATKGWLQFGDNVFSLEQSGVAQVAQENVMSVVACGGGCVEITVPAATDVTVVGINGQLLKSLTVQPGTTVVGELPVGAVIVNGFKVLVK